MVDPWEACQDYKRTALVLDHFDHEINDVLGGVRAEDGEQRRVRMMLLAGSDLISTMSEPGVWSEEDVRLVFALHIVVFLLLTLVHYSARSHTWEVWLLHRRTCRDRYDSGH